MFMDSLNVSRKRPGYHRKYAMTVLCYIQGYFCDTVHLNAITELISQKDASWNRFLEPFFLALI
jgi:hypothetical protein